MAVLLVPEVISASGRDVDATAFSNEYLLTRCYLAKPIGINGVLQRVAKLTSLPKISTAVGKITPIRPELV